MSAPFTTFRFPSRPEIRWAAGFAGVVMALTCLPYLYGLLIKPEDAYYSGFLTNPDEHNVYLAYMKQAREGALFLIDPFTSEPQQGRVVNLFFLALGRFARATSLALPIVYHVARVICGWLLLMAIYCLGAQAMDSLFARRLALALVGFASGLGWLYHAGPGQPHPIDYGPGLVMPEAITFLTLLLNPLFCFSAFLMVVAIGLGAHALRSGLVRSSVLAGLACLLLGNIHTYDIIPVAVVLAAYLMLLAMSSRRADREPRAVQRLSPAFLIALIASPSLAYQLWLLKSGEVTLAIKTTETPVRSPEPLFLALGLGLPLLLALMGVWRAARPGSAEGARLLAMWLVLGFALAYLPIPFQRKLAQGIHVPVVLLAVFGLEPGLQRAGRLAAVIGAGLVLLVLPSNALYLLRAKRDLETNNTAYLGNLMPMLYLRDDQYLALAWLDEHASFRDVLLCNSFLGSYAPSLAGTRVYVGHWAETLHYPAKLKDFARFLRAGTSDMDREAFLRSAGINYVLRDRSIYDDLSLLSPDGTMTGALDFDEAGWLEKVCQIRMVSVYRVR